MRLASASQRTTGSGVAALVCLTVGLAVGLAGLASGCGGDDTEDPVVIDGAPDHDAPPEGWAVAIDPVTHDFGDTNVGQALEPILVTVTSTGSDTVPALLVTVDGAGFTLSDDTCTGVFLNPTQSCTFRVALDTATAGDFDAVVRVAAEVSAVTAGEIPVAGRVLVPGQLVITPLTHDFGLSQLGQPAADQSFTVANTGAGTTGAIELTLGGTEASHFAVVGGDCDGTALAASDSCTVVVRFTPTAIGRKSASLTAHASPGGNAVAALIGRGQTAAKLTINPDDHDFEDVLVGDKSGLQLFVITNSGEQGSGELTVALAGEGFEVAGDTCTGLALEGGTSCQVSLRFAPTARGEANGTLTVTGSPGGGVVATLHGQGQTPATLALTPATQALGTVVVGQVGAISQLTVTNQGDVPSGDVTVMLASLADVELVATTCGPALAAGDSCTIDVRLAPSTPGAKSVLLSASATPGGDDTSTLTGNALAAAHLTIAPASFDFGSIATGQVSGGQNFTITNDGGVASGAVTISLGGDDANQFELVSTTCGPALAVGDSCAARVRFKPTTVGNKDATLRASATPGGLAIAELKGNGLAVSQLKFTPTSRAFGSVGVGAFAQFDFTLENTGTATAASLALQLSGTGAAHFQIVSHTCGTSLAAGAMCSVRVRFAPSSLGSKVAALSATGSPGGSAIAALSGTGTAPATLSLTPATRDFGGVSVGNSTTFTFTLSNTGTTTSGTILATIGGDTSFTIDQNNCTTLAPSATCSIRVRFTPTATGAAAATLLVAGSPGGTDSSTMSGNGQ